MKPGAHELPKEAKERATEFLHNPNYIITFQLSWLLLRDMVSNNEIVVSLYGKKMAIMAYEFGL